ncbi:uncharacterized protein Asalp_21040 [Aeromonas salmonicida subsp. pectinolytica 34mel]|uniref:Uncharacterized protein n=1 Tax=Aeromonas salmonicida subsp. pectinolytica 34mel TaxID=1324960 RepID=A0A2D1QG93_AERSA|nr:uncharacterized protein Asalp_21040 [Aeromonas salmonicida subsp. pectinolytica 34mel]
MITISQLRPVRGGGKSNTVWFIKDFLHQGQQCMKCGFGCCLVKLALFCRLATGRRSVMVACISRLDG